MKKTIMIILVMIFSLLGCEKEKTKDIVFEIKGQEHVKIMAKESIKLEVNTNLKEIKVTWKSSNPSIASIDEEGTLTGNSQGFVVITAEYDTFTDEIGVNVEKTGYTIRKLTIEGKEYDVREKRLVSITLRDIFGPKGYYEKPEAYFEGWYIDKELKTKLKDNEVITQDFSLYPKFISTSVECEKKIKIGKTIGYKDTFDNNQNILLITPAYGHLVPSFDYSKYSYVFINYRLSDKNYYIEKIEDSVTSETVIPNTGAILTIKKDSSDFKELSKFFKVGKKLRFNHYATITSDIIYLNHKEEKHDDIQLAPKETARYACMYDAWNKNYLYKKRESDKTYPASTTKIITAMAALKNASLDDTIVVGDELDITFEASGPSLAHVHKGQKWNLRNLLYGLLLPSGNDAAFVIGALTVDVKYPGNTFSAHEKIDKFKDLMNEVAVECGMTGSHFMVPDGNTFPGERFTKHYITAIDMCKVANYALTFGALAEVFRTVSTVAKTEDGQTYPYVNGNRLIKPTNKYYYKGAVGLKTGYTDEAMICLVSAVEKKGRFIIAVSLYNWSGDITALNSIIMYNAAFKNNK